MSSLRPEELPGSGDSVPELVSRAHELLLARGATAAAAESLTGGLIAGEYTARAGASATFRGGVVAYASSVKAELLGVPGSLLAEHGAVHPEVAEAMASGVRGLFRATYGLAATGVAGPGPQEGLPAGTVYTALSGPQGFSRVVRLALSGDRRTVRADTVRYALRLLCAAAPGPDDRLPEQV